MKAMELSGREILYSLKMARWVTALRTYGNHHSTLIGLLVDCWVSGDPERRWALESGPTNGYAESGVRGQCDALFCFDHDPLGVLEVEGYRYQPTARKIGTFFDGQYKEFQPIRFGILLLYTYAVFGNGTQRAFPSAIVPEAFEEVRHVTERHPTKPIIIISLDKTYQRIREGIRAQNEYYKGEPSRIQGFLYENGQEVEQIILKANVTS